MGIREDLLERAADTVREGIRRQGHFILETARAWHLLGKPWDTCRVLYLGTGEIENLDKISHSSCPHGDYNLVKDIESIL